MLQRRQFILGTATLFGATLLVPSISLKVLAETGSEISSGEDKFSHLMKKWIALYDSNGGYLAEIKLVKVFEESSDDAVEQFSLRWETREESSLEAGIYVLEDFSSTPMLIYLEPSYSKKRNGRFFRASFSLLKN
ncbi:hypothetical protein [Thalassotalea atypica]|uniref:hypothetical protein n=1 Tax=Thalassotalea atypica TaxID=2054316 RepID=UPI002572CDF1|nr:hypothetical protein [Thalassotalea atypica]